MWVYQDHRSIIAMVAMLPNVVKIPKHSDRTFSLVLFLSTWVLPHNLFSFHVPSLCILLYISTITIATENLEPWEPSWFYGIPDVIAGSVWCQPKYMMKKLSSHFALTVKHLGFTLSMLQSAKESDYKIILEKLSMLQKMEFYSKSQKKNL